METKNILIILLVIVLLICSVIITYSVVSNMNNSNTYERVNLSATCSLELPKINFKIDNSSGSSSFAGIAVNMESKVLSSNDLMISYVKTTDNTGVSVGGLYTGNSQFNVAHQDWYSRDIVNSATGESILVMGKDKAQVDKIADSIKFTDSKGKHINATDVSSSHNAGNNSKTPYAYADDGSPIWTEAEFEKYVMAKGGYSSLKDYYDTQKQISHNDYTPSPSPEPSPTPTPTPTNRTAKCVK